MDVQMERDPAVVDGRSLQAAVDRIKLIGARDSISISDTRKRSAHERRRVIYYPVEIETV